METEVSKKKSFNLLIKHQIGLEAIMEQNFISILSL